jgi:hypothetical protein
MDEEIVADADAVLEAADEIDRGQGDMLVEHGLHLLEGGVGIALLINVEAEHGFTPAMAQEMAQHLQLFQRLEKHFLVIAQKDAHRPLLRQRAAISSTPRLSGPRSIRSPSRMIVVCAGAAVLLIRSSFSIASINCANRSAAMDVAHRIDPLARRNGAGQGGAGPEKFAQAAQHSFCKIT